MNKLLTMRSEILEPGLVATGSTSSLAYDHAANQTPSGSEPDHKGQRTLDHADKFHRQH
ncbi:MAG TPA: hypothetical protein VFD48_11395 [Pyrinomonadaceae bacterium]|nr:hypothetical protein [Pyrinomonadaceae bacterium]